MSSSITNFKVSGLTARLFEIIEQMNEEQKKEILVLIGDQRKHKRKPYLISVSYNSGSSEYKDFILDISPGGAFIETNEDFFIGQELAMELNFKNHDQTLTLTACVVWQSSNGVGVKFLFKDKKQIEIIEKIISII